MALWRLIPDPEHLDHPLWARVKNIVPFNVVAVEEWEARLEAGKGENARAKVPGADTLHSPWMDPSLVHAEVVRFDLGPY